MSVSAYTYGTVAKVEALVGDIVVSRTFSTNTTPKLAQIESLLDDVASEIHAAMAQGGYTPPTSAALTSDAPRAAGYISLINVYGACALALQSMPYEAQAADADEAPNARGNWFQARYKAGLAKIAETGFLGVLGLAKAGRAQAKAGARLDDDSNEKEPYFRRNLDTSYQEYSEIT